MSLVRIPVEQPLAIGDPQHRGHHEIASGEAVAVEIGLVAQRVG
jgi:hypothetical protein